MTPTGPGPASAQGIRLVNAHTRELLSPAAVRLILETAEILHEGDLVRDDRGAHWYGTTFLSLDMDKLAGHLAVPPSPASCRRLLALLRASPEFRVPLMRMARREILRRLGKLPLMPLRAEMTGRVEGSRILVDIEIEMRGLENPVA